MQFVDARCERVAGSSVRAQHLFDRYRSWAADNGIHKVLTMKSFRDRLARLGFGWSRDRHGKLVTGIALNFTEFDD
jgi:hypothetical protein